MGKGKPQIEPRLLADVMLGSLARWLRILGFDTVYDNRIRDGEIARRCAAEDRLALTRDRRLVERRLLRERSLLVQSDRLADQLRETLAFLSRSAQPERILSRCLICNSPIQTLSKEDVRNRVPPFVYRTQQHFKYCPSCRRIYWGGTHRRKIMKKLEKWGLL